MIVFMAGQSVAKRSENLVSELTNYEVMCSVPLLVDQICMFRHGKLQCFIGVLEVEIAASIMAFAEEFYL